MEAYKFATTVLEDGIIKIPELKGYADQKVCLLYTSDAADE